MSIPTPFATSSAASKSPSGRPTSSCRLSINPWARRPCSKINTYHAKLFSNYLAKLKTTPDGDGSLLDHITILYGAGLSNSNGHSGDNLPLMLVGGHAGKIQGGRHLKFANKPSQANLLMTIMDKM